MFLFSVWMIVADDDCEVCHCRISFLFQSVRDRPSSDCGTTESAHNTVLAQNAVGDVFQLCHNSNSRVLAPFNEIRLVFHWLTWFCIYTADPLSLRATTVPWRNGEIGALAVWIGTAPNYLPENVSLFLSRGIQPAV
jgi:hypothetical protein